MKKLITIVFIVFSGACWGQTLDSVKILFDKNGNIIKKLYYKSDTMSHSEPKVTIDLSEYKELLLKAKEKEPKDKSTEEKREDAYKEAIFMLIAHRGDVVQTTRHLRQSGAYLFIPDERMGQVFLPQNIKIVFEEDEKSIINKT